MEFEFTKLSSKGQVVIPREIRTSMKLKEGTPFAVIRQDNTILLKKMEMPKIKTWEEVSGAFKQAAKKSGFNKEDLDKIMLEVRNKK